MLSRVANTLYWMVRYVERADNLARLIDVNRQLLLDSEGLNSERLREFWKPIILCTGDEDLFHTYYQDAGSNEVIRFLTEDPVNPNSIVSCISMARENARTIRDQLSDELWEELNALYLFASSAEAGRMSQTDPTRYYGTIRRAVFTFLGVASSTTMRNQAWDFMELGRYLERADKTTRFLDIASYLPDEETDAHSASAAVLHHTAILRSCGAMGAFRTERKPLTAFNVLEFLVFSKSFPRSVLYCIERVDQCLHHISGAPRNSYSNTAEREAGRLLASLSFGSANDVGNGQRHEFLDSLQGSFNLIGDAVFDAYVLMPSRIEGMKREHRLMPISPALWEQQQQQQQ